MLFYQLFESETSTYTYLLADEETSEAIIIDPVFETFERDLKLINELGLTLLVAIDTHLHADHTTGAGLLRKALGTKTAISTHAKVECADLQLKEGDMIKFGKYSMDILETPGHTDSCIGLFVDQKIFTGDLLFIRGTGRTDFQQGDAEKMYDSIVKKIFSLPDATVIYPAHNYKGLPFSTVGLEKKFNPRININRTKEDFIKIMSELNLPLPKKINEVVPNNLKCGMINGQY